MKKPLPPNPSEIKNARLPKDGDFANGILYRMCRENPRHKIPGVIGAKINIIGRVYAASIERGRKPSGAKGDDFWKKIVLPKIKGSPIDKWFDALNRGSSKNIDLHLATHMKVMILFRGISNKARRSFVSKYLHFHFPDRFYIFDSRAVRGISRFTPSVRAINPQLRNYDSSYVRFYLRCEALNNRIERSCGQRLSPREMDNLLLGRG